MDLYEEIFEDLQIRRTKEQKDTFISIIKEFSNQMGYEFKAEGVRNRNVVVGDPSKAEVILSAHYDTCTWLPYPRFVMPQKRVINRIIKLLIFVLSIVLSFITIEMLNLITKNDFFSCLIVIGAIILFVLQLKVGFPNRNNKNDNTSGVITLLSIMDRLRDNKKIAYVFFDNEEIGLKGSRSFRKEYVSMDKKLLINFDCISDGDNILLVSEKETMELPQYHILRHCFERNAAAYSKNVLFEDYTKAKYGSDHKRFKHGVGVVALKKARFVGLYLSRIHSRKDNRYQQPENIEYLSQCIFDFSKDLSE